MNNMSKIYEPKVTPAKPKEQGELRSKELLAAARFWALLKADEIICPCRPPLMQGGWFADTSGDWGRCGIFAPTLTELADRLIEHWKQHDEAANKALTGSSPV